MKSKNYAVVKVRFEIIDPSKDKSVVYENKFNSIVASTEVQSITDSFNEISVKLHQKARFSDDKKPFYIRFWDRLQTYSRASRQSYYRLLRS